MSLPRNFPVTADVRLVQTVGSTGSAGSGKGDYLFVGRTDNDKNRSALEVECDFTDAVSVERAVFSAEVAAPCGLNPGGAVRFFVERATSAVKEGPHGGNCSFIVDADYDFDKPTAVTTNRGGYSGTPVVGRRIEVVITAMVEAYRAELAALNPPKVKGTLRLRLIAANAGLTAYDESDASRFVGLKSRHTTSKPRIETVLDDNHPPGRPAYSLIAVSGTACTFRITRTDEDAGDYITATESEWYTEAAEDDENSVITAGSKVAGRGGVLTASGTPVYVDRTDTGFTAGQNLRPRWRTRDRRNVWGTWGRLRDPLRFNTRPTAPINLTVTTDSVTPDYGGTLQDVDPGAQLSGVEIQVRRITPTGVRYLWNATSQQPGDDQTTASGTGQVNVAGGTDFLITHAGEQLTIGEEVERRLRTVDQYGGVGDFTQWIPWTPGVPDRPVVIPAEGARQDTLTPAVGAQHSEAFDRIRIWVYRTRTGTELLWEPAEQTVSPAATSKTYTYGSIGTATPLAWGQTPGPFAAVQVRIASTGTWTPVSDRSRIRLNTLSVGVQTEAEGGVVSPDGTYVTVTTQTPRLVLGRLDPDLPQDTATRRVVEIWAHPRGVAAVHTQDITTGITDVYDVPSGVWAWEQKREVRHRYAGQEGVLGGWGEFRVIKASQPLVLTEGTAVDVNDPTPTVPFVATSPSGKSIVSVEMPVYLVTGAVREEKYRVTDTTVYASGSTITPTIPAGVLRHGLLYEAIPRACDSDGLCTDLQTTISGNASGLIEMTAVSSAVVTTAPPSDTFTRAVVDGWGSATVGGAWTLTAGGAANFDVDGARGTISIPSASAQYSARLGDVSLQDVTATVKARTDKLAVGAASAPIILLRFIDVSNYYALWLEFKTDATLQLSIRRFVGGSLTTLASGIVPGTHVAGTDFTLKFQVSGVSPTTVRAKAWLSSGAEPGSWQLETTDSTAALQLASAIGLAARLNGGTTNAPTLFSFDDLTSSSP
jgi:hypothetical protein